MTTGICESLITQLLQSRLQKLDNSCYIGTKKIEAVEAAVYLSRFPAQMLSTVLDSLPAGDDRLVNQIDL